MFSIINYIYHMKAASVAEIKKDLSALSHKEVIDLCLRLARFKKENKELLTYLLYESSDEDGYITSVKEEVDNMFAEINYTNMYFAKKSFRKILRIINKYIRYTDVKNTEIELLIYYCKKLKTCKLDIRKSNQMVNLFERQVEKVKKTVKTLHEDLQYDYQQALEELKL
jgi:hypothetical protein